MSKPQDIEQNAWFMAGDVIAGTWAHDLHLQETIARAIMVAKAEEREGCAAVAEGVKAYLDSEYAANPADGPFAVKGGALASEHIAAAIRKRGDVNTVRKNSED